MVRPEMADGMPSRSSGKATPTSPGKPRSRDKVFGDLKNEFPNLPDAVITETLETFYRKSQDLENCKQILREKYEHSFGDFASLNSDSAGKKSLGFLSASTSNLNNVHMKLSKTTLGRRSQSQDNVWVDVTPENEQLPPALPPRKHPPGSTLERPRPPLRKNSAPPSSGSSGGAPPISSPTSSISPQHKENFSAKLQLFRMQAAKDQRVAGSSPVKKVNNKQSSINRQRQFSSHENLLVNTGRQLSNDNLNRFYRQDSRDSLSGETYVQPPTNSKQHFVQRQNSHENLLYQSMQQARGSREALHRQGSRDNVCQDAADRGNEFPGAQRSRPTLQHHRSCDNILRHNSKENLMFTSPPQGPGLNCSQSQAPGASVEVSACEQPHPTKNNRPQILFHGPMKQYNRSGSVGNVGPQAVNPVSPLHCGMRPLGRLGSPVNPAGASPGNPGVVASKRESSAPPGHQRQMDPSHNLNSIGAVQFNSQMKQSPYQVPPPVPPHGFPASSESFEGQQQPEQALPNEQGDHFRPLWLQINPGDENSQVPVFYDYNDASSQTPTNPVQVSTPSFPQVSAPFPQVSAPFPQVSAPFPPRDGELYFPPDVQSFPAKPTPNQTFTNSLAFKSQRSYPPDDPRIHCSTPPQPHYHSQVNQHLNGPEVPPGPKSSPPKLVNRQFSSSQEDLLLVNRKRGSGGSLGDFGSPPTDPVTFTTFKPQRPLPCGSGALAPFMAPHFFPSSASSSGVSSWSSGSGVSGMSGVSGVSSSGMSCGTVCSGSQGPNDNSPIRNKVTWMLAPGALQATQDQQVQLHIDHIGEQRAYEKALIVHQRTRYEQIIYDLQSEQKRLEAIQKDITKLELQRSNSREQASQSAVTVEDIDKLRTENRRLQIDIEYIGKEIEAERAEDRRASTSPPPDTDNFHDNMGWAGQEGRPRGNGMPSPAPSRSGSTRSTQGGDEGRRNSAQWSCLACTFSNHPYMERCEVCEMPRFKGTVVPPGHGNGCYCHPPG